MTSAATPRSNTHSEKHFRIRVLLQLLFKSIKFKLLAVKVTGVKIHIFYAHLPELNSRQLLQQPPFLTAVSRQMLVKPMYRTGVILWHTGRHNLGDPEHPEGSQPGKPNRCGP